MIRYLLLGVLLTGASLPLCAAPSNDEQPGARKALDNVLAKAGIHFGGEFKSQFFQSTLSGDATDVTRQTIESNEYTSVDFDVIARPNEALGGRLIFRMYQNWQNFFSDISNPIFSRWISIDANVKDLVSFHAGDFKAKYSPLTLQSPDIEVLYEPAIFARKRTLAMEETFIGDNQRVLQGLNVGFDAEVFPAFNEVHLNVLGVRLRNAATDITDGSRVASYIEEAVMEKYAVGGNLDTRFLKGMNIGGTFIATFDHKGSSRESDTTADTMAQLTRVLSVRPGADIGKILGSDNLRMRLHTEFAFSSDDSSWFNDSAVLRDTVWEGALFDTTRRGSAYVVTAEFGYTASKALSLGVSASYIQNSRSFRSDLAQSPSFVGEQIMNVENGNQYSTFDALYHHVFKFVPTEQTNLWHRAPFSKNSFTNTILTARERDAISTGGSLDPSVQLVMPFGLATPNRRGLNSSARLGIMDNKIELQGVFAGFSEINGSIVTFAGNAPETDTVLEFPVASLGQFGGGAKIDLSGFVPIFKYPFELSGSFVSSFEENAGPDGYAQYAFESSSDFVNLGLYYKFWKRMALLGGFQKITNTMTLTSQQISVMQYQWAAGLEWTVAPGSSIIASAGEIRIDAPEPGVGGFGQDFNQFLVDLSLQVRF